MRSDRATVEVIPPRAGASEIRTPEGFIRVESGVVGADAASFGVYRRAPPGSSPAGAPAATPPAPQAPVATASGSPMTADPCRPERSRYVKRLLYMAGIDMDAPVDFVEALAGTAEASGPFLFTEYGLLPGIDPIRPLAWDLELRSIARDLVECRRRAAP